MAHGGKGALDYATSPVLTSRRLYAPALARATHSARAARNQVSAGRAVVPRAPLPVRSTWSPSPSPSRAT